jgi:hypothetical protein
VSDEYPYPGWYLDSDSRFVFRNIDPETGWAVRKIALDAARELEGEIERRLPIPDPSDSAAPVSSSLLSWVDGYSPKLLLVF